MLKNEKKKKLEFSTGGYIFIIVYVDYLDWCITKIMSKVIVKSYESDVLLVTNLSF